MYNIKERVLSLIKAIRESFYGSDIVYTKGSCYQLFKILSVVFPTAEAYYFDKHIYTKIEGSFYDINGIVKQCDEAVIYTNQYDLHNTKFDLWSQGMECPSCDDIIPYHDLYVEQKDKSIKYLNLSARSRNSLMRYGISTISKLCNTSDEILLSMKNLGEKSVKEIKQKIKQYHNKGDAIVIKDQTIDHTINIDVKEISEKIANELQTKFISNITLIVEKITSKSLNNGLDKKIDEVIAGKELENENIEKYIKAYYTSEKFLKSIDEKLISTVQDINKILKSK